VTDAKGCSSCTTANVLDGTGVYEISGGASISISPNPFNSVANVSIDLISPAHGNLVFVMFDMFGREIQSVNVSNSSAKGTINFAINRGDVSEGIYFYRLQDESHILTTGKIAIQ